MVGVAPGLEEIRDDDDDDYDEDTDSVDDE